MQKNLRKVEILLPSIFYLIFLCLKLIFLFCFNVRENHTYTCALSVDTFNKNAIFFTEIQTDPFADIVKPVKVLAGQDLILYAGLHLPKARLVNTDTVVCHGDGKILFPRLSTNTDMPHAAFILDAVIEGIFYQRLDRDLGDTGPPEPRLSFQR